MPGLLVRGEKLDSKCCTYYLDEEEHRRTNKYFSGLSCGECTPIAGVCVVRAAFRHPFYTYVGVCNALGTVLKVTYRSVRFLPSRSSKSQKLRLRAGRNLRENIDYLPQLEVKEAVGSELLSYWSKVTMLGVAEQELETSSLDC